MTMITPATITSANPGPALEAVIETAMLAIGWTLVDTVIIGGNTHKVFYSAAAGNSAGKDWYLDINYPTTGISGGIRLAPFEGYNATTHLGTNGPYNQSSTTVNPTSFSQSTTAGALETLWANSTTWSSLSTTLSTTTFTYYISVTRDRIIMLLTSDPLNIHYSGFFTPSSAHAAAAGSALYPLVVAKIPVPANISSFCYTGNGPSNSQCALTRAPNAPTGSWFNWQTSLCLPTGLAAVMGAGVLGGTGASPFTANQAGGNIPLWMGFNNPATFSSVGGSSTVIPAYVGYLSDVIAAFGGSTATSGNTVTIGADTWYFTNNSSGGVLAFKGV